jgi:hypothetical protein
MFVIELAAPFLFFVPWRHARHAAALATIGLMLLIALTGNYTFFNLLTIALCLPLLDDAFWRRSASVSSAVPHFAPRWSLAAIGGAVVLFTAIQAVPSLIRSWRPPAVFGSVAAVVGPFRSLNNYGLFMVMTTERPELVIEGSRDGRTWLAYEFRHKPGDPDRRPTWGRPAPTSPRLANVVCRARSPRTQPLGALPLRTPAEELARRHRVAGAQPVRRRTARATLRIVRHDYRFTNRDQRARTGRWWERTPVDYYVAPTTLR